MIDPKTLLANVDSNGLVGKMLSGMATKNFAAGLLSGGVATALLGKSDVIEGAAKLGGMALLGTLAYKAYNDYQQTKATGGNASVVGSVKQSAQGMMGQASGLLSGLMAQMQSPQQAVALTQAQPELRPEFALAVIRAMIGAAKADGHVDAAETQKIFGHIESQGLSSTEKSLLMQEMANTPDIASIASGATSPEEAAQVYLAAVLVCDSQCAAEQAYLAKLADSLKLDAQFVNGLQQELLAMRSQQAA